MSVSVWWKKKDGEERDKKKGTKASSPPSITFERSGSLEKNPLKITVGWSRVSSGEMVLDGNVQGLKNPLCWENTPAALKEKFPHWKTSSSVTKTPSPGAKDASGAFSEEHAFQLSSSSRQPDNTIPYVVMECDTLNTIALKFETTPGKLAQINKKPLGSSFVLFPGDVLYVPDPNSVILPSPPAQRDTLELPQASPSGRRSASPGGDSVPQCVRDGSPCELMASYSTARSDGSARMELPTEWGPEEVTDTHICIVAKYMSEDQGCVQGGLHMNSSVLIFAPHSCDPLVQEAGKAEYEMVLAIEDITYAALCRECYLPHRDLTSQTKSPPLLAAAATTAESVLTPSTEESRTGQPQASGDASSSHGDPETSSAKELTPPSSGERLSSSDGHLGAAAGKDEARHVLELTPSSDLEQNSESVTRQDGCEGMAEAEPVDRSTEPVDGSTEPVDKGTEPVSPVTFTIDSDSQAPRSECEITPSSVTDPQVSSSSSEIQTTGLPPTASAEPSEQQRNQWTGEEPFDRQDSNFSAGGSEDLLQIMGVVEPRAKQTDSKASRSDSGSSGGSDGDTGVLLADPCFLHIRVSSSKSGFNHTYTPLSKKGIEIPQERDSRGRSPRLQLVKSYFCFAVPEKRIEDIVRFLSRHHAQSTCGSVSPSSEDAWHHGVFNIIGSSGVPEDLAFHDSHFESGSWEIFSMKDIATYRARIANMENLEEELPLPTLTEESDLLEEEHVRKLVINLPSGAVGRDWYLIYSTFKHGISLRTLYRKMMMYEKLPVLLVIRDEKKKLFGAVMSCPIRISDRFYGTGESFLYSFEAERNGDTDDLVASGGREEGEAEGAEEKEEGEGEQEGEEEEGDQAKKCKLNFFPWTGKNSYFVKGNSESVAIGGGTGHFGLWLDENFYHGSSFHCDTYNNDCLASTEDFICSGLEAWGFSQPFED